MGICLGLWSYGGPWVNLTQDMSCPSASGLRVVTNPSFVSALQLLIARVYSAMPLCIGGLTSMPGVVFAWSLVRGLAPGGPAQSSGLSPWVGY